MGIFDKRFQKLRNICLRIFNSHDFDIKILPFSFYMLSGYIAFKIIISCMAKINLHTNENSVGMKLDCHLSKECWEVRMMKTFHALKFKKKFFSKKKIFQISAIIC